ncbi:SatD family protein [Gramella sp. AN32]|uniref:SatD family protein n=1 Tax=Christiangramia antarctica TaxID=2058158 RepID=A0ABW5XBT5_9FLAO|nr:SatD family protein [Gramella sp. AN32]MCM4157381.1 hypothetical protein [Gramella sp. AN32]
MIAVISADFISSTAYSQELMQELLSRLKQEFSYIQNEFSSRPDFKIYRGDSFQGIVKKPSESLRIALILKTAINKVSEEKSDKGTSKKTAEVRMGIGIGTYDFKRKTISEANGQAFQFSGRTLDNLKAENRKTKLTTEDEAINKEFDASFYLLDTLTEKWSIASAEVVYYLLKGLKETEIADKLKISQPAVNQRKKAAGWDAIEKLLDRFEEVISQKFTDGK